MKQYILALDQGTSSSRAIVFDETRHDVRRGAEGVPSDLPAIGLGRARSARDMVVAGVGDRRGHHDDGHQRSEPCRYRHHEPARDDHRVGFGHRRTDLQCHRMAGPPYVGLLRRTEEPGPNGDDPPEDRSDHRRLLQRHEDQVDSGQRPGGPQTRRTRAN